MFFCKLDSLEYLTSCGNALMNDLKKTFVWILFKNDAVCFNDAVTGSEQLGVQTAWG